MSAAPPRRKLLVVDGANAIFRAFFAIPGLRAPDGTPTNAAYGFTNMLQKLVREEAPDFVAVAHDARGGTFRNELFDGYKAGRDATPEDLIAQMPLVRELMAAHKVPWLEAKGFEADDLIATLVARVGDDVDVAIVSTDKDLMQLVSARVTLLDGMKDRRYTPADVEERFGVPPELMLDVRALVGDPSDNIPGVKGIGEKGAAKLIREWKSLEKLLEHAGDVKAKRAREALKEHADDARLSKELSTLRDDVPLDVALDDLARGEADPAELRALYTRLGFTRLVEALDQTSTLEAPVRSAEPLDVRVAADAAEWRAALSALPAGAPLVMVPVATPGGAVDARLLGMALATDERGGLYAPLADEGIDPPAGAFHVAEWATALSEHLRERGGDGWLAPRTKQLQSLAAERGLVLPPPAADLSLAAFLVDPAGTHALAPLARQELGLEIQSFEDVAGRGARATPVEELPVEVLAEFAVAEACAAAALAPHLAARLERDGLTSLYADVELPLTSVLSRVERNGVRIDEGVLAALSAEYEKELDRIEKEIYALAGEPFKVNSPKQLQQVLFEKLTLTPIKKTKTGYSTDEGVLEQLAAQHELPGRILGWRRLAKLKSTYIDALPPLVSQRTGRIHPEFNQVGAATGRMSCTNPNVQNIPIRTPEGIRIREAFVPAEGRVLLSADYSQVELRILAHYSGDESLITAFQAGEDIHRRTAALVAGIDPGEVSDDQRARAKAVNFGIVYGSSAFGLAQNLGIATGEAQETIDAYFETYKGVRRFLDETIEGAREAGFVTTLLGRRRYLPDLSSRNRVLRQAAERMAVNTVIQGSEADLIKSAMVAADAALAANGLEARMILQVHDELVFEAPRGEVDALEALARREMSGVFELAVPLVVDVGVGADWRQAH